MESNPTTSQMQYVPITLEKEIFGSQYTDTLNSLDDGNITKATGLTTLQMPPETCSLYNNSVPLYKSNGVNLELIAKLTLFTQLPDPENEKIENSLTPQMDFPKIYDKILKDEKNLEK
ncbi:12921_t:CDS:2 [Ambispora leptoticha]|uniref:12921_t:CDS:1 n=1 Tax=Ambispora leptoticha TaxID=144679 RepID=A0A9N8VVK6_9GLOM|nr:12921_t:CDS:2 [Ambispora leptoticha]